jgi:hypothetical protein
MKIPAHFIVLLFFGFTFFSFSTQTYAQKTNLGINFQALARDKESNPAVNRKLHIQVSILKNTSAKELLFKEEHETVADNTGVFSISIGLGLYKEGISTSIEKMDWSSGPHQLNIKIAIEPLIPVIGWDYQKEWIDLGTLPFGVVPYALHALNGSASIDPALLNSKLNVLDTTAMLKGYTRLTSLSNIEELNASMQMKLQEKVNLLDSNKLYVTPTQLAIINNAKLNIADTATMLQGYVLLNTMQDQLANKLSIADTAVMLSTRIARDTFFLSNRINLKEDLLNKSTNISNLSDYNDTKYPSVKAIKNYVDAAIVAGAPDADMFTKGILKLTGDLSGSATNPTIANDAITTIKILNGAVTNEKLASGIAASKVGLGNLTNNAQVYSINGLTSQVQDFSIATNAGVNPYWNSTGSTHTLYIPLASANSVTAGLISKSNFDQFQSAYNSRISTITNTGNNGTATLVGNTLNVPAYNLDGLAGTRAANVVYAGPSTGASAVPNFRYLVAADIPNNAANTSGNAGSATILSTTRLINNVGFNGSTDITINASTPQNIVFDNSGLGDASGVQFNGASATTISYNTLGAAPDAGSSRINTLGNITSGTWAANKIGNNYGGAGNLTGLLKANNGVVAVASVINDYQVPLLFDAPLVNNSNLISLSQANSVTDGYLSKTDWNSFNNKIDQTQIATANGVASLDVNGKIPSSQIPAISFSTGVVVQSQAEMLAIPNAVTGTIAIRTDDGNNYVLSALPATTISNWLQLAMPASIQSVNGQTGNTISLTTDQIAEGSIHKYFTTALARNAWSASSPLNYNNVSGLLSMNVATTNSNGYLTSTDWNSFNSKQNSFSTQNANSFFAAPDGSAGAPLFRAMVVSDVPTLNQNTTGTAANITATSNTSLQSLSNLTTVGTISAGTWSASVIDGLHGGTGIANAGKTISLGGNISTAAAFNVAGAFSSTFRLTGLTDISFPMTGRLATLDGVESFTNKTLNGVSVTAQSTGLKTLTIAADATVSGLNTGDQTIILAGDIAGSGTGNITTSLAATGVSAGTYGNASTVPVVTVDTKGRVTSVTATPINSVSTIGSALTSGNIILGNASNVAANVTMAGDVTIANTGITSIGTSKVTNSMLSGGIASSKLVGTDITTVGTIGSGTWNATLVAGQYGGTGVNNTNKTITLGGNMNTAAAFSTTGANALTLNTTTATNVTLPGSGTLATLSGVEILANKNIVNASAVSVTGDVTAKRYLSTIPTTITAAAITSLDLSTGNVITINLGVNVTTLTVTGAAAGTYLLKFVQDATGSRDVSFPAAWKWAGGVIPNLTNTANKIDIVTLIYDGTNYYATIVQNF